MLAYGIWGEAGPPHATDVAAISASNPDLFLHRDTTISSYPGPPGACRPTPATGPSRRATTTAWPSKPRKRLSLGPRCSARPMCSPRWTPTRREPPKPSITPHRGTPLRTPSTSSSTQRMRREWSWSESTTTTTASRARCSARAGPGPSPRANGTRSPLPPVTLQAGERYWLALLSPKHSGVIRFRDLPTGSGGATKVSAQTDLTATCGLPRDWRSGGDFTNSPASAYLS